MQTTSNYGLFKTVPGNRKVNHNHVEKLVQAIEKKNLLAEFPIIINENMEIIDGQHRLFAAQQLGIPVPYVINKHLELTNVISINSSSRPWTVEDYVESFIELGDDQYVQLKNFKEKFNLGYGIACGLLGGKPNAGGSSIKNLKNGTFKVQSSIMAEKIATLLNELQPYADFNILSARNVAITLWYLFQNEDFDPQRLIGKLDKNNLKIERRLNVRYYILQFEELYNFNVKLDSSIVTLYAGQL